LVREAHALRILCAVQVHDFFHAREVWPAAVLHAAQVAVRVRAVQEPPPVALVDSNDPHVGEAHQKPEIDDEEEEVLTSPLLIEGALLFLGAVSTIDLGPHAAVAVKAAHCSRRVVPSFLDEVGTVTSASPLSSLPPSKVSTLQRQKLGRVRGLLMKEFENFALEKSFSFLFQKECKVDER